MLRDSQITIFRFFLKKKGPIKTRNGSTVPRPRLCDLKILNTPPITVEIEKLESLKSSGQAIGNDYLLLGYFYSLEKKYDLSKTNYLTALKLATDDGRKAIIQQELEKLSAVTPQVIPVGN